LIFEKNPRIGFSEKLFKGGFFMELFVIFGIGILVGIVCTTVATRTKSVGSLRVDTSDPDDGPYLFLELPKDIGEICQKKYVTFKVSLENFIPHE
jgi:hypothetical protein